MADIGTIENYHDVETQGSLEALPAGPYTLVIVESDCAHVEKAQGRRITVTYEVQSGPHAGRKGWDRFDIDRVAVMKDGSGTLMIDLSRFKTLVAALGFDVPPGDTSQMHGMPFVASAKVKQDNPKYAPKNEWGSYRPVSGAPVQAAPQPARQPAPVQRQAAPPPTANGRAGGMAWPARR